jgi:hypothetical protein
MLVQAKSVLHFYKIKPVRGHYNDLILREICIFADRLCGLVVRVLGDRSRGPGFDSQRYQVFLEVVCLERGPLSLMNAIEELLGRNSSGSGIENREYGRGDMLR